MIATVSAYDDLVGVEKRLFSTIDEAIESLNQTVRDKFPWLEWETAHEWYFRMSPSVARLVRDDPNLTKNLRTVFDLSVGEIAAYVRLTECGHPKRLFLCAFDHVWALLAWSKWLQRLSPEELGRPLLIHLDHHDDLLTPPLLCTETPGVFRAVLGGSRIDVRSPAEVYLGARRGQIGIGSFIAPFLHAVRSCDVLHFCLEPPGQRYYDRRAIELGYEEWCSNGPVCRRPAIVRRRVEGNSFDECTCHVSNDLTILRSIPATDRRVLLDIDLDFFCNRFDRAHPDASTATTSLHEVRERIDQLADVLRRSEIVPQIEVVTLALSPGFYPSDYWADSVPYLNAVLDEIFSN